MAILTNTKNVASNGLTILDSVLDLASKATAYTAGVTVELSESIGASNQEAYNKGREHTRKAIDWTSTQINELVNPSEPTKETTSTKEGETN